MKGIQNAKTPCSERPGKVTKFGINLLLRVFAKTHILEGMPIKYLGWDIPKLKIDKVC
jgi:hypothetical protein